MTLDQILMVPPGYGFDAAGPRPTVVDITWQADGGTFYVSDHEIVNYNADTTALAAALDSEYPFAAPWSVVDNGSSGNTKACRCTSGVDGEFTVTVTNIDLYTSVAASPGLTVTTQGANAVNEVVTVTASGIDDVTTDSNGNSVTNDGLGAYASHSAASGWTAGSPSGSAVQFTKDVAGPANTTLSSGSGSVVVDTPGVTAAAEVTSINRGGANAGSVVVSGGSFAYDASAGTVASSVGTATSHTFNGTGTGTSGDPWILTNQSTGAQTDLAIDSHTLETRTGSGGTLSATTVTEGSPAPIFYETFVGSNGTTLNGLTPDVGPNNLVVRIGAWTIQDNRASCGTNGIVTADIGVVDFVRTAVARTTASVGVGFIIRYDPANGHFYMVNAEAGSNRFRIYRYDGSFTQLQSATVTINTNTNHVIVLTISGTTVTATINGGNQIQQTGATQNSTATHIGIRGDTSGNSCLVETDFVAAT